MEFPTYLLVQLLIFAHPIYLLTTTNLPTQFVMFRRRIIEDKTFDHREINTNHPKDILKRNKMNSWKCKHFKKNMTVTTVLYHPRPFLFLGFCGTQATFLSLLLGFLQLRKGDTVTWLEERFYRIKEKLLTVNLFVLLPVQCAIWSFTLTWLTWNVEESAKVMNGNSLQNE